LERRAEAGGVAALAATVGRLRRSVIRDLRLDAHGLELLRPEVRVFAPQPDGGAVTLWADPGRTARELTARSPADAAAYPSFDRKVRALASFLAHLAVATPPDLASPSFTDAFTGLKLGRALRGLGSPRALREVLRVLPMSVEDLVVVGLDPKRTLLGLVDPIELGPTLAWRAGNIRTPGVVAHLDLVLDRLPRFPAARGDDRRLGGRIVIGPGLDELERAQDASKYGQVAEEPFLEATIPTVTDPTLEPEGRHRMRVLVQGTPHRLREGTWTEGSEALGDQVL